MVRGSAQRVWSSGQTSYHKTGEKGGPRGVGGWGPGDMVMDWAGGRWREVQCRRSVCGARALLGHDHCPVTPHSCVRPSHVREEA